MERAPAAAGDRIIRRLSEGDRQGVGAEHHRDTVDRQLCRRPDAAAGADVHVDVQQQTYRGTPPTTNSECPVVIPGTSPELRNLVVTGGSWAAVSIPAKSTRSLSQLNIPNLQWPHVQMPNLDRNQDGCKNTTFLFTYTGTATK